MVVVLCISLCVLGVGGVLWVGAFMHGMLIFNFVQDSHYFPCFYGAPLCCATVGLQEVSEDDVVSAWWLPSGQCGFVQAALHRGSGQHSMDLCLFDALSGCSKECQVWQSEEHCLHNAEEVVVVCRHY